MERLSGKQEDVMMLIWELDPCFVKDVWAAMPEPRPPYTTVASVFKVLERKKYLKVRYYGNSYEYRPLIAKEDYMRERRDAFAANYFNGSYKEMVASMLADGRISAAELQEILAPNAE